MKGAGKTVRIEGAELQVCVQCEKYGKEVQRPKKSSTTKAARFKVYPCALWRAIWIMATSTGFVT
jgi:ribosome-binding protein aMBF1 (putative translation factor)